MFLSQSSPGRIINSRCISGVDGFTTIIISTKAQVKDIAKKTTVSKIPITPGGDITSPTPKEPDGAGPPIRDTNSNRW